MIQIAKSKRLDRISPAQESHGTRAEMNIRRSMTQTKRALLTPVILLILAINPAGRAETKPEARSFAAFWIQFKTAVAKDDKEAVAEMTKIPFPYGTKHLSKAEFIKEYGKLFDKKTQRCFSKAKPVKEDDRDSYSVFCGEEIFVFEKVNGEYRFTDIGMND